MVTNFPGKGRGLVAARDIKRGDLLFKDRATIKLRVVRDTNGRFAVNTVVEEFVKLLKNPGKLD